MAGWRCWWPRWKIAGRWWVDGGTLACGWHGVATPEAWRPSCGLSAMAPFTCRGSVGWLGAGAGLPRGGCASAPATDGRAALPGATWPWWPLGSRRLPSAFLLPNGVTLVVGLGVGWRFSRRRGGASGGARGSRAGGVAEVAGTGFSHVHARATGVVQLGENPHQLTVGTMAALLGVGLPAEGIMVKHYALVAGALRVKT